MTAFITDAGAALIASSLANGTQINLTEMTVGTGLGAPDKTQIALQAEVFRAPLSGLLKDALDPGLVIAEMRIGALEGGWDVTEAGLLTDTGVLFALSDLSPISKTAPDPAQPLELLLRMVVAVNAPAVLNLNLDPATLASRAWVKQQIPPSWEWIRLPRAIAPLAGALVQERATLLTGPYYHLYDVPHATSRFQVRLATDTDWDAPLYDSGDVADLTVHRLPLGVLVPANSYQWRLRHTDVEGVYSRWSSPASFATVAVFNAVQAPEIINPLNGATSVPITALTLNAGDFAVSPGADTHATSRFQIRLASDADWSAPLYDSGDVPAALSHTVPDGVLSPITAYIWRVAYGGTALGLGAWSVDASFTLAQVEGQWMRFDGVFDPINAPALLTFTVPTFVTRLRVTVLGGMAGGIGWDGVTPGFAGGSSGGYGGLVQKTFSATPGDNYTVVVASPGLGGLSGQLGTDGATSSFVGAGATLSATGGTAAPGWASLGVDGVGSGGDLTASARDYFDIVAQAFSARLPGVDGAELGGFQGSAANGNAGAVMVEWGPGI